MWARDNRGNVATEYILGGQAVDGKSAKFDGEMVQCFPDGGYGWHTGTGNSVMHRNSVGIEVCCMGQIVNGRTYVNTVADPSQIIELAKPFRGFKFWHNYSDAQITALKNWILFVANKYSIDPRIGLVEYVRAKGADGFDVLDLARAEKTPGMYSHTNVIRGKVDMYPHPDLIDMLLSL
jgi:hypothetical protein